MIRRYLVVLEDSLNRPRGTRLSGFVPDVPGCWSIGTTLEELRANLHTALKEHLHALAASGRSIPEPIMGIEDVPVGCLGEWMAVKGASTTSAQSKRSSPSSWDVFTRSYMGLFRRRVNFV